LSIWLALGLLVGAGLILILQHDGGTIAGLEASQFAGLVASLALLIYLGGSIVSRYQNRLSDAVRHFVLWSAFALVLIAAYSYREDLKNVAYRVAGELLPPGMEVQLATDPDGGHAVRIRRQFDGHFIARTTINGTAINMIVDTGASTVVLRHEDAAKIGIDTNQLIYSVPVQTANGTSKAAKLKLQNIAVGPVSATNVDALIAQPGMLHQSLLGMSFLSRLRSYEFSGDFLTLRSS
jgi:aspartyl protease family protein